MRLQAMTRVLAGAAIMVAMGSSGWVAAQSGTTTVLQPADLENFRPQCFTVGRARQRNCETPAA